MTAVKRPSGGVKALFSNVKTRRYDSSRSSLHMNAIRIFGLIVVATFTLGCAATSTSKSPAPTHYWEADVPQHTYNRDNQTCQSQTGENGKSFEGDSLSFQKYRNCMIEKGYTLRTY